MRKILSLIAGLGLAFLIATNVSADTPGINVSTQKQDNELVVTVTADGSLGGVVVDLEFDASELYCDVDRIVMPTNSEYVVYECEVTEGTVSIGFVAVNPRHVPNGTIATITFAIAEEAQSKTAEQFTVEAKQVDVITLSELISITGISLTDPAPTPTPGLADDVIADKVAEIEDLLEESDGTTPVIVTIDMTKEDGTIATEVPVEFLEAIQGENVVLVLTMGDYTWTINGQDVDADEMDDVDLEVILDADAIDEAVVEQVADGQPSYQISIPNAGDFGFKATLGVNLGDEYEGQYGNLYRYENGKLVFQSAGLIDENGNVNLEITCGADYVIIIGEDASAEPEEPEDDTENKEDDEQEETPTVTDAKTPWGLIIGIIAGVVVLAGVGFFVVMKVNSKRK